MHSSLDSAIESAVGSVVITADASIDGTTGTPSVTVTPSGANTNRKFSFAFSGLKGEKGDVGEQGPQGPQGETGPQGPQGEKGDSPTIPTASSSVAGIMKLFTSLGQNTDGAPTNKAVQDAVNGKANSSHSHTVANITDISMNKNSAGYISIGGIIIQWGHFSHTGSHGSDVTITFSKAFSNTNYSVCVQQVTSSTNETWSNAFCHSKTTTNFKFRKIFGEKISGLDYIAIGY